MSDNKNGAESQKDNHVGNTSTSHAVSQTLSSSTETQPKPETNEPHLNRSEIEPAHTSVGGSDDEGDTFHDAEDSRTLQSTPQREVVVKGQKSTEQILSTSKDLAEASFPKPNLTNGEHDKQETNNDFGQDEHHELPTDSHSKSPVAESQLHSPARVRAASIRSTGSQGTVFPAIKREKRSSVEQPQVAEWSHQQLAPHKEEAPEEEEVEWQAMTAIDEYDIYDDNGKLVARGAKEDDEVETPYMNMGGASKGYTRILFDDDARSTTSLDEDTEYLFKKPRETDINTGVDRDYDDEEENQRDVLGQLEATKDLLTEGQRIAYVGVVRLATFKMLRAMEEMERTRGTKKEILKALESMEMWGQQMMVRLYKHMEISNAEQLMIEQLAEHGLEAADLVPPLMQHAKVKNPMAEDESTTSKADPSSSQTSLSQSSTPAESVSKEVKDGEEVPQVHGPEDMPKTKQIELDIRWTVLCDLFLVLISDSNYDARSRRLLERVASTMKISWTQICRFEKKVIDQLEMQEAAKENWDESEHMEERRKKGLRKKYMVMGMATVGGGLVIGLSAGLLAPVIGAGLAAGFTTIGITGTAGFLGGVGGAALITSAATATGGTIAIRASNRRTGHVKTFEYRPLHNNKRLNLILTISGWMTGKVDDVRLPFSTVDPIMGDIYSLLWEPEMLQSMGDTINILATEALTQSVQQVLGSTILVALMASLQLPIVLTKLAYLIDNPWTVSLDRANAAGLILADSLMARHLGQRPITLVSFSLGSRLIFSCLKELANRGAYGLVQNVFLFGSPVVAKKDEWLRARSVIAGRFVNGYASNDWILGYLFRATSGGIMRVAGLAPVEGIPGLENLDVTDLVNGHMAYRTAIPKLLRRLGWEVESDEFTEIEDPDPENHAQRQRELIQEIDEARRKAEEKPEKRRFGIFKRGKLAEKQNWEKYQAAELAKRSPKVGSENRDSFEQNTNVLFDIDAIRKELISEQIEVRELDSNQPPMQFTTIKDGQKTTEYFRLPPGIKPEEVGKIKLPPRPDEIDDDGESTPPLIRNGVQRTVSSSNSIQKSPNPASKSPLKEQRFQEYDLDQPKELVSTLPPLRLTPQINTNAVDERPGLKKHNTEPMTPVRGLAITSPTLTFGSPELDRNAWADGNGEVKMTFE